ncbi:MAG: BrnT family toxin [Rhodospirillaceae bacterium]
MSFEWDADKNRENVTKHGVRFEDAVKIFDGFTVNHLDVRSEYGEDREISIGMISGVAILVVVHTDRNGVCRIISARPAIKSERRRYEQAIRETFDT